MSFVESIQLKDGQIQNLDYHQRRMDFTLESQSAFPRKWNLKALLSQTALPTQGTYKIRVVYTTIAIEIEWKAYQIKPVQSLQLVHTNQIDYTYKSTNRALLQHLFKQRKTADDIIICKNGWITDSYYANLAFYQNGHWYTPDSPLLAGTKRQVLLDQQKLKAIPIQINDLKKFERVALINAMIDLNDKVWVESTDIYL